MIVNTTFEYLSMKIFAKGTLETNFILNEVTISNFKNLLFLTNVASFEIENSNFMGDEESYNQ